MARVPRKPDGDRLRQRERRIQDRVRLKEIEDFPGGGGGGAPGVALKHLFAGGQSGTTGLNSTVYAKCTYVVSDDEGLYDTATGEYTVPEPGWYLIYVSYKVTGASQHIVIWETPSTQNAPEDKTPASGGWVTVTGLIYCDFTDAPIKLQIVGAGSGDVGQIHSMSIGMLTS